MIGETPQVNTKYIKQESLKQKKLQNPKTSLNQTMSKNLL